MVPRKFDLQDVVPKCNPGARCDTKSVISSLDLSQIMETNEWVLFGLDSEKLMLPTRQLCVHRRSEINRTSDRK
jgi:hypothetical protein